MDQSGLSAYRAVFGALALACVAGFLVVGIAGVLYPYDLDMYEGTIFLPALRIVSGRAIYGREVSLQPPYLFAIYGPLYYALVGLAMRVTGLVFWPGRLISLVATTATGAILGRTVTGRGGSRFAGLSAAAIWFLMPSTWAFGAIQRVDALGTCFSVVAVCLLLRAPDGDPGRGRALAAGAAAALALLVKISFLPAGGAAVLALLLTRRFRGLGWFLAGSALVLIGAVVVFAAAGAGDYRYSLQAARKTPFLVRNLVVQVRAFGGSQIVVAALALAVLGLRRDDAPSSPLRRWLPSIYLLATGFVALTSAGRAGGSINYFLELGAALALTAGLGIARLEEDRGPSLRLAVVLLIVTFATEMLLFRSAYLRGRLLIPAAKRPLFARLEHDLARSVPLDQPIAGEYIDAILRTRHALYFNDLAIYQLGPPELSTRLAASLARHDPAAVIMARPDSFPGYRLVAGYQVDDPGASAGQPSGPLLYLRDDLWQQHQARATPPREDRPSP